MGEMGKDICPNFHQPFLENIDRMQVINVLAYRWIRSKWLISAMNRVAYHIRVLDGRTPHIIEWKPISKDLGRSVLSCRSIILLYLQLLYIKQREQNPFSVWTPRSLTNLDSGIGVPDLKGASRPIVRYLHFIGRSHFFAQSHSKIRGLRSFMLCPLSYYFNIIP